MLQGMEVVSACLVYKTVRAYRKSGAFYSSAITFTPAIAKGARNTTNTTKTAKNDDTIAVTSKITTNTTTAFTITPSKTTTYSSASISATDATCFTSTTSSGTTKIITNKNTKVTTPRNTEKSSATPTPSPTQTTPPKSPLPAGLPTPPPPVSPDAPLQPLVSEIQRSPALLSPPNSPCSRPTIGRSKRRKLAQPTYKDEPLYDYYTSEEMAQRDLCRLDSYLYYQQESIVETLPLARVVNLQYYLTKNIPVTNRSANKIKELVQKRLKAMGIDDFPPNWTLNDELPMQPNYGPLEGITPITLFDVDQDYEDSNFELAALISEEVVPDELLMEEAVPCIEHTEEITCQETSESPTNADKAYAESPESQAKAKVQGKSSRGRPTKKGRACRRLHFDRV
ncbi:hypothetical protein GCK32_008856 [Trichostrongylus colubriformis]|uniref:Uncharacterized protein n=1 Tax=Trichostrongylus colubriformis TaxID=6319 RepID=A0AAN8FE08_TRICO